MFKKIQKKKIDTITNNDIHCSKSSLTEMIKTNSDNIKNSNPIDKISSYEKTFLESAIKSRERQFHL